MGLYSTAELVYGIHVTSHDEDGSPYPWWNEAEDDWVDLDEIEAIDAGAVNPWPECESSGLGFEEFKRANPEWEAKKNKWYEAKRKASGLVKIEFNHFGHYENPDGPAAVISPAGVPTYSADCWSPKSIPVDELKVSDKRISKAQDYARYLKWSLDFYTDASWLLVASYG